MHKEFAVEPTLINSFDRFRALIDGKCGWDTGRLIAAYPKRWKKLVYEACSDCRDVELSRITESLQNATFLVKRKGAVPPVETKTWVENSLEEHKRCPFAAIVADDCGAKGHDAVLDGQLVGDEDLAWRPPSGVVSRNPSAFAEACALLLMNSDEIKFIDPHFSFHQDRFVDTLVLFMETASRLDYKRTGKNSTPGFELHCEAKRGKNDTRPPAEIARGMRKSALQLLREKLPERQRLHIHIWKRRDNSTGAGELGEKFHNRYIITEHGGISFGTGLDVGSNATETDDLGRLSPADTERRRNQYSKDGDAFDLLEKFVVVGEKT